MAFERTEGRRLFGSDPAAYDAARPGHAERVYEILVERCGLAPGTAVLEVGPGTGQATKRLLELGARPLVVLEPDAELARYLEGALHGAIDVRVTALEDAELPMSGFDLAVAASSFHWVDEPVGLARLSEALCPGGWCAIWWTLFGVEEDNDPFIAATSPLLDGIERSPSHAQPDGPPYALDVVARTNALEAAGFEGIRHETAPWNAEWDTQGIRMLYSTFSPIARLDSTRRSAILDGVADIAAQQFGGHVTRRLRTALYIARKPF